MKKQKLFFLIVLLGLCLSKGYSVRAEEIEVQRGEEAETEIFLEGSSEVYSAYGELKSTGEYALLKSPKEKNDRIYQAEKLWEDGTRTGILLSRRSDNGYGLWLRLNVEGIRIGTETICWENMKLTDENGGWLTGVRLPEITVRVLPNPLEIYLSGNQGNNGWYTGPVTVTVSDKDAETIWYDLGEGKKEYTKPFQVQHGETELVVSSDDGYGYKKEEICYISIDAVAPSIKVSTEELDWQQENMVIEVICQDGTSGIDRALWAISDSREYTGSWQTLSEKATITVEQDGVWYLHMSARDEAGNETEKVYGPYRKDAEKPEIDFVNLSDGQLAEDGILPQITVEDSGSGIKQTTYLLDGESWNKEQITGKGKHTLTVTAEDFAGNICTETVKFSIYDSIKVTAEAGNCHYTGTASCSALVLYHGEPLAGAMAEFYINGESVGTKETNEEGMVWMHVPMELSPQEATLTVVVPQDDENFLLGAEDSDSFTIKAEKAWLLYGGDYHVWYGDPLRVHLEMGELPDFRMGDITRAEVLVELYKIENDGSKTLVEEEYLSPDEKGVARCEFNPETGLYELRVSFTENSCYTGETLVLHPAVFDIDAELDWEGGSLLLDLPQLGIYASIGFTFLPPSLEAEVEVRIPGTGITLTENELTGYDLGMNGLVLYGRAVNPADGTSYSYEVRTGYTMGFLLDELETFIWKGEDKTKEPVYHFEWSAAFGIAE